MPSSKVAMITLLFITIASFTIVGLFIGDMTDSKNSESIETKVSFQETKNGNILVTPTKYSEPVKVKVDGSLAGSINNSNSNVLIKPSSYNKSSFDIQVLSEEQEKLIQKYKVSISSTVVTLSLNSSFKETEIVNFTTQVGDTFTYKTNSNNRYVTEVKNVSVNPNNLVQAKNTYMTSLKGGVNYYGDRYFNAQKLRCHPYQSYFRYHPCRTSHISYNTFRSEYYRVYDNNLPEDYIVDHNRDGRANREDYTVYYYPWGTSIGPYTEANEWFNMPQFSSDVGGMTSNFIPETGQGTLKNMKPVDFTSIGYISRGTYGDGSDPDSHIYEFTTSGTSKIKVSGNGCYYADSGQGYNVAGGLKLNFNTGGHREVVLPIDDCGNSYSLIGTQTETLTVDHDAGDTIVLGCSSGNWLVKGCQGSVRIYGGSNFVNPQVVLESEDQSRKTILNSSNSFTGDFNTNSSYSIKNSYDVTNYENSFPYIEWGKKRGFVFEDLRVNISGEMIKFGDLRKEKLLNQFDISVYSKELEFMVSSDNNKNKQVKTRVALVEEKSIDDVRFKAGQTSRMIDNIKTGEEVTIRLDDKYNKNDFYINHNDSINIDIKYKTKIIN